MTVSPVAPISLRAIFKSPSVSSVTCYLNQFQQQQYLSQYRNVFLHCIGMDTDLVSILVCPLKLHIPEVLRCLSIVDHLLPVCSKMKLSIDRNSEPIRWNRWDLPQIFNSGPLPSQFNFLNFQLLSIPVNGDNLDDNFVPRIQRHSVKLPKILSS